MNKNTCIGLGTAAIGRPQYINIKQQAKAPFDLAEFKQQGLAMLDFAYATGIRYFDTAPGYGLAEQLLIEWLSMQNDPSITVATKWGYTYAADFIPNAKVHEIKNHTLEKLNEQWKVSKQLLPYLKYYQIHSATLDTGVLENKAVLEQLYQLKKENNLKVGLTTTGSNQTEVLKRALDVHFAGEPLFEVFQCTYNILDQSILSLGKRIVKERKQLVLKEVLANGRLFPNPNYPNYSALYVKLEGLSKKYGVGVDAVILQYCIKTIEGAMVLSGANKTEHLEQNLKAANFQLSPEEIVELSQFKTPPITYWEERKQLAWN